MALIVVFFLISESKQYCVSGVSMGNISVG